MLDTQGPEIRTGDTNIPIDLNVDDEVTLTVRDEIDVETSSIKVNYKGLVHSVDVGSKITVDNELFNKNSIILIEENNEQIQQFKDFIDGISPEDFS